jgi:hypothetical protein
VELERSRQVDCDREVARGAQLDVNPDMIQKAPHVQVSLLRAVKVPSMAEDSVEALGVVLDS